MEATTAATIDEVGELHKLLTAHAKKLMESEDPAEKREGVKLALELTARSKVNAIDPDLLNEKSPQSFRNEQKKRFADANKVKDLAEERAKRAANDV